jgi:NADPH-dependent 2,4-dienoyl-CoA reductase/sulfur reductase-like enzyme
VEQAGLAQLAGFALSLANQPAKLVQAARYRTELAKIPYRTGCWIASVSKAAQDDVLSVRITDGRKTWEEECDLVACGFHLVPNTEAASLLGCRVSEGCVLVDERQQTTVEPIFCAGEATGIAGLDAATIEGEIAGFVAAGELDRAAKLYRRRDRERCFGERMTRAFRLRPELRLLCSPETIVCRCEDVTFAQLQGRTSWTDAKLQTRCGMGACQGRVCRSAVETLFGWSAGSVRPPVFPAPVASFCEELPAVNEMMP